MSAEKIGAQHRARKAILYVRQSSAHQVQHNRESQILQYAMRERLVQLGWSQIEIVDEDLGCSAAGGVTRAGFERMVAEVCLGKGGPWRRARSRGSPATWSCSRHGGHDEQRGGRRGEKAAFGIRQLDFREGGASGKADYLALLAHNARPCRHRSVIGDLELQRGVALSRRKPKVHGDTASGVQQSRGIHRRVEERLK